MDTSKGDYKNVCKGVFLFCGECEPPSHIVIEGISYERFLDSFYLDRPVGELTKKQISEICRLRELDLAWQDENSPNSKVRQLFTNIVFEASPQAVFEIGPGIFPLFPPNPNSFNYLQGDLDERVVAKNKDEEYKIFQFDADSNLPLPNDFIDMLLGVFVFQFDISENQIREIERILNIRGVLLANVYRRTEVERQDLKDRFRKHDLLVNIFPDPRELCRQHQYWLVSKSASGSLYEICRSRINSISLDD